MIHLVLQAAAEQTGALERDLTPVAVEAGAHDTLVARQVADEAGDR